MMTVHEVSKITGVSIRALHHYDRIGLLPAARADGNGYRLYDDTALERLQTILLFRELELPLRDIREILDTPGFNRRRAVEQQIRLLELKREHLENLIVLARKIWENGEDTMDFNAFDTKKMDEYAAQAKASWGNTAAYREYELKAAGRPEEKQKALRAEMEEIFRELGAIRNRAPEEAAALIGRLREHITANYYTCTEEILLSLGTMYAAGGEFTENIDKVGGFGTAEFSRKAIEAYVKKK